MDPDRFLTHSLRAGPWGAQVCRILVAAIQAVDPYDAMLKHLQRDGDLLTLGKHTFDLSEIEHIFVVGAGKAGAPMAQAAEKVLGEYINTGLVIVKEGYAEAKNLNISPTTDHSKVDRINIQQAGHPLPDQRGVDSTRDMIGILAKVGSKDLVLCLISGGGSALMAAPVEGIVLDDLQTLTQLLLKSGAEIDEINALRKHLDQVKGGKLARLAAPAQVATLVLSDVIGDPLDAIASGPTVPDTSSFASAIAVLNKYDLIDQVPPSIGSYLEKGDRGEIPENPQPGDPIFDKVNVQIIGSNRVAAQAAIEQARTEGMNAMLLTTFLQGEAREAGRFLGAIARQIAANGEPLSRPACLVIGGETTVTITGDGRGGRNQELALGAVSELDGLSNVALVTLATDGGDGPTDAAGAVVTGGTKVRARQSGLNPADYLQRNDAYYFFSPLGDLLKPGPTQTNVNDLALIFAF